MPKKRFALIPSEREKECTDHQWQYQGKIPNTGAIVCRMCGARWVRQSDQWTFENFLTPRG